MHGLNIFSVKDPAVGFISTGNLSFVWGSNGSCASFKSTAGFSVLIIGDKAGIVCHDTGGYTVIRLVKNLLLDHDIHN